jgi:short-subunit dehydrogenase
MSLAARRSLTRQIFVAERRVAEMLLKGRNAVVYGAGGALGGAVSRGFAREGAAVFLTGRRLAPLDEVATKVLVAGGTAETAVVDANAEQAVEEHAQTVVDRAGPGYVHTS